VSVMGAAARIYAVLVRLAKRSSLRLVFGTVVAQAGPDTYRVRAEGNEYLVKAADGVSVRAGQTAAIVVQHEAGVILLGAVQPL
jgi:hypothetical protein